MTFNRTVAQKVRLRFLLARFQGKNIYREKIILHCTSSVNRSHYEPSVRQAYLNCDGAFRASFHDSTRMGEQRLLGATIATEIISRQRRAENQQTCPRRLRQPSFRSRVPERSLLCSYRVCLSAPKLGSDTTSTVSLYIAICCTYPIAV